MQHKKRSTTKNAQANSANKGYIRHVFPVLNTGYATIHFPKLL
jgi:hypothetical protein